MNPYQLIYETMGDDPDEVMDALGMGDVKSVQLRREKVSKFLEAHEWDHAAFVRWLKTPAALPGFKEEVGNAAESIVRVLKSHQVLLDHVLGKTRWDVCIGCECLTDGKRCSMCGCAMFIKTKMPAMQCPLGLW